MKICISFMLLAVCWVSNATAYSVGFEQTVVNAASDRPLKTNVWYPSEDSSDVTRIGENIAFIGTDVVEKGAALRGKFPLVVLSHGYRGNWRNQNWLATRLAREGYIVAAINHPGTSSFDHSPTLAAQWWERPGDLSRLLDWLLTESALTPLIDQSSITAIGHSLGGWTVMALAGARFDREQLIQECHIKANPRVCGLMPELGLDEVQIGEPKASLKDERISRVVSLDLGLARSLSRQSLRLLNTPVLILAAGVDIGNLPQQEESGFLAQYIPKQKHEYIVYPDATHFSFMQRCKPGAVELIEEEEPGDGIVCKDGYGGSRMRLHSEMFQDIVRFLSEN
jgi:predicted dienelactone hydrolase